MSPGVNGFSTQTCPPEQSASLVQTPGVQTEEFAQTFVGGSESTWVEQNPFAQLPHEGPGPAHEGSVVVVVGPGTGQETGTAGASFRLRSVSSFFDSYPPNRTQYCLESVPSVTTMPTAPVNGVVSVTPVPLHVARTTRFFTRTSLHGSPGEPSPLYL